MRELEQGARLVAQTVIEGVPAPVGRDETPANILTENGWVKIGREYCYPVEYGSGMEVVYRPRFRGLPSEVVLRVRSEGAKWVDLLPGRVSAANDLMRRIEAAVARGAK